MPFWIGTNLKELRLKRGQIILSNPRHRSIIIGEGKSPGMQSFNAGILIGEGGKIVFKGNTVISQGTVLRCDRNAVLEFGDSFYCNCNCYFRSTTSIVFGDECSLGWNVTLNTCDGHPIWHNGVLTDIEGPIEVGSNVWLTPHCSINKNVTIANHCVVAQGAIITKPFNEEHCLIGGIPAKVISTNINWRKK